MGRSSNITDELLISKLNELGFDLNVNEARLMLVELMIKASSGYYNSHYEELFLNSFNLLKKDRTPNKKGFQFMKEMLYSGSNKKSKFSNISMVYRND